MGSSGDGLFFVKLPQAQQPTKSKKINLKK